MLPNIKKNTAQRIQTLTLYRQYAYTVRLYSTLIQYETSTIHGKRPKALGQMDVDPKVRVGTCCLRTIKHNKALRHVENVFIQRFLFIHPRFVFVV